MRVQLGRASHILETARYVTVIAFRTIGVGLKADLDSKKIERVLGRLSFRRSSSSLRALHNNGVMARYKDPVQPDFRKA